MQRFEKILVYAPLTDADDPALLRAAELARNNNATVEVVDAVEELPAYVRLVAPSSWDVAGLIAADREKHLQAAVNILQEQGVEASTRVLRGKPDIAVIEHVIDGGFDLVLKTARSESSLRHVWFGLLAKRLLRNCPCPVWILQPDDPPRYERVVAAVDAVDSDAEKQALNRKILDMATSLATQDSSQLHIIHAWDAPGETLFQSRMPVEELAQYVADCKNSARSRVEELLAKIDYSHLNNDVHLLKGDPHQVIMDYVGTKHTSLVVMGTVCRSGIAGYLIGNTAEKVLRDIGSSVLAIKPEGFQAPLAETAETAGTRHLEG